MTIETCIAFCGAADFVFAGIEFGHCDSTIQIPSVQEPATDCDMACSGNSTELCGGPVRINIFQNLNTPLPVIVQNVTAGKGLWTYQGCFTDTVTSRTLGTGVNIPSGTTAESCTAACQAAGGFQFAGLENGHECWCDNQINAPGQHVGDADCREVCSATHAEYCGNSNRVAVYEFSASGVPPVQVCQSTSVSNFTLVAEFATPPTSGPLSVPLKLVAVEIVGTTIWSILSVRVLSTLCSSVSMLIPVL
ncbi:hypothetical protein HYPSUDRAFT_144137 [Hypholoma sublateritium FD-334 SS-4]|uniref:WSC domain-containing protein n=1 Tax=Hypholoma sublateritium (strain FD-334 SS-4) TaxID=945553 RepID=A0A0D2M7C0_HYPSF|nr:hypothetical protein HYPSUDRAFT_144137 [Hypholoma sublateritium FD-334 SS-4]